MLRAFLCGLGSPVAASMASRTRGRHGGGVTLSVSALALLLVSPACIVRAVDRPLSQAEHATSGAAAAAAAASAVVAPRDAVRGSSREETGAGVFDFSFGQLRPETPLPDVVVVQAATRQHDDGDDDTQVQQQQQHVLSPPPSALSLRECSLGDAGVAEVARSPWVCGATAVRSLSLRQNQVRGRHGLLSSRLLVVSSSLQDPRGWGIEPLPSPTSTACICVWYPRYVRIARPACCCKAALSWGDRCTSRLYVCSGGFGVGRFSARLLWRTCCLALPYVGLCGRWRH